MVRRIQDYINGEKWHRKILKIYLGVNKQCLKFVNIKSKT
jgi:hypothetical protein